MTTIDYNKALDEARKMAAKAKAGIVKINGDIYTFEFNQQTWDYVVYKNLFHFVTFNTKELKTAKRWLVEYINN